MRNAERRIRIRNGAEIAVIIALCVLTVVLEFSDIAYVKDEFQNRMLSKIIQHTVGFIAALLLMRRLRIEFFGKPQNLLFLLPCVLVAVNNFQFSAYFQGKMELVRSAPLDILLFVGYCLTVGLFEECIFRGIVFSVLADLFSTDRKGFLKTYFLSSVVFGAAHLLNGVSLGTLLQVGYAVLTGGLFAFCVIKTKNVLCCAFVHALYNFCGLLYDEQGLGAGVVFDVGTVVTMTIVGVCVGVFVLCHVWKYTDEERKILYKRCGIDGENEG